MQSPLYKIPKLNASIEGPESTVDRSILQLQHHQHHVRNDFSLHSGLSLVIKCKAGVEVTGESEFQDLLTDDTVIQSQRVVLLESYLSQLFTLFKKTRKPFPCHVSCIELTLYCRENPPDHGQR